MSRLLAVAANTFRETVRERVLYNLVFFAILMTLSGLLLGQLSIRQDEKIIKDIGLAAMDLFGMLIAVFMGIGLVSKEIERRSLYPLLAKPLTRGEFFLGKFAGLAFTLLVNLAVMTAGLYLTLARRPGAGRTPGCSPRSTPSCSASSWSWPSRCSSRRSPPPPWRRSSPWAWWWPDASPTSCAT